MIKIYFLLLPIALTATAFCQVKQITVERQQQVQLVALKMKTMDGDCTITPCQKNELVSVHSHHGGKFNHTLQNKITGSVENIFLDLQSENRDHSQSTMLAEVFGQNEKPDDWNVYLTETLPYNLDLQFGFGDSHIDLSNTSVKKLKINTGSADITVFYRPDCANKVVLDTFFVTVGMGKLEVKRMSLARPKVSIAEVGFGEMYLDFGTPYPMSQQVVGKVGAGKLIIRLPPPSVPVKANIHPSFLCRVNIPSQWQSNGKGEFENEAFHRNPAHAVTFDLEVSVGKIDFISHP